MYVCMYSMYVCVSSVNPAERRLGERWKLTMDGEVELLKEADTRRVSGTLDTVV